MAPSALRVATRHLASLCSRTTGSAWISPEGDVVVIRADSHAHYALKWYSQQHPEMFAGVSESDIDAFRVPSHLPLNTIQTAFREILAAGWIRASNWSSFQAASARPSLAWRAAAEMVANCVVETRRDPERAVVFVDHGQQSMRLNAPEFILTFGDRRMLDRMYERL